MGPPERIVAGVVLCERLAVGMYGAVHRAQREGQRHLRALVVDARLLAEPSFQSELLESSQADKVIALDSEQIVPTLAIESEGPDVVVLTRGVGRYVTVQDMLASSRARGFKIERSVVAAVALATSDALAAAHRAEVVHGAVHPRSVLVDEEGAVRLTDFGVGRALTSAVAQGGDSQLWRGLAGFLAPELAIGAMPAPESDVFALGALVFVMLTGDAPPGTLATTAAVERVVTRALDTEPNRRYRNPAELAEALRIAFATDGWAIASPTEIIASAGLQSEATGIDSDTEDLLAALGSAAPAPVRPVMDLRAEAVAARPAHAARGSGIEAGARLEALLADLGDEDSRIGPAPSKDDKDPGKDSAKETGRRRAESPPLAAPSVSSRDSLRSSRGRGSAGSAGSPKLDLPSTMSSEYDVTPLPAPQPQDALLAPIDERALSSSDATESAAMSALEDLRDPTLVPHRAAAAGSTKTPALDLDSALDGAEDSVAKALPAPAPVKGKKPDKAQKPATSKTPEEAVDEAVKKAAAARKKSVGDDSITQIHPPSRRAAGPMLDLPADVSVPSLRRSPLWSVLWGGIVVAAIVGAVFVYQSQKAERSADEERREREIKAAQELSAKLTDDLPDPGRILLGSNPSQATGWLLLGRTPFDSLPLSSEVVHQVRVELERYRTQELSIDGTSWQSAGGEKRGEVKTKLERATKTTPALSALVPEPAPGKGLAPGSGKIHFESDPPGAAVWLYIGVTGSIQFTGIAGQPYELRALKDGFLPGYSRIAADDWRAVKNGAAVTGPIDSVEKKSSIDVQIELTADPDAPTGAGGARRKGG